MRLPSLDTLIGRVPVLWRAVAAMLILCGAIGALVESRARILRSGAEVRLRTVPVDPRDLFRGDYVVLGYQVSRIGGDIPGDTATFNQGDTVYVTLGRDSDGFSRATAVSKARPAASGSDVVMAGRVVSTNSCGLNGAGEVDCAAGRQRLRIAYGIESYFVPQGTGRPIETTARERLEVVVAVAASGEAAIKRLLIDGKLVHAEPPY